MRESPVRITPLGVATILQLKSLRADPAPKGGLTAPDSARLLCVAPGEWLVISREHSASSLRERLEPQPDLVLADLSEALVSVDVRGAVARDLLSKGCGLDLHPDAFPAGRYARTRFAQIPVVIECLDEPPRFELHLPRSYFRYLHSWLLDAAIEFAASSTQDLSKRSPLFLHRAS